MNKSYLIVPLVLLIAFSFVYSGARKEMKEKEEARLGQKAAENKAEADRKKIIEEKATADAIKRQEDRAIADKAKEDKKEKDYLDAMAALKKEADDYSTQVAKLTKEASDLEADILKTRNDKERLTREALELSKQVELAKINRRTSELEIQRMIEMVSKKLSESSLTALPPPPPPRP
jgi:predicted RNase H-like nuclease (RuvC/YqgF family)